MWPDIFFLCRVRGLLFRLVLCSGVAAALVLGSVSLCGGNAAHAEVAKTQEHAAAVVTPPLPVTTVLPIRRTVQRTVQGQGVLFAKESVMLSNKLAGSVSRVSIDFGDKVKAGQVLAEMEREEYELQVGAEESAVRQARATYRRAQGECERAKQLFAEHIVPSQRRDTAAAEEQITEAALQTAEKRLAMAQKRLRDTRIMAPVDGFVQQRLVHPGAYLAAGTKMFEVVVVHPLKLRVPVPERYARLARPGVPVRITVEALPGESFGGTLTRLAAGVEQATRSLVVEAEMPNPEGKLRPGYVAHLTGVIGEESAVFIPRVGLYRTAGVERVFVVKDGVAMARAVQSGVEDGDFVEIVAGLALNEPVIVSSVERVANGMQVQLLAAEAR